MATECLTVKVFLRCCSSRGKIGNQQQRSSSFKRLEKLEKIYGRDLYFSKLGIYFKETFILCAEIRYSLHKEKIEIIQPLIIWTIFLKYFLTSYFEATLALKMYVNNMQIMFHILASKSSILNDFPFPLINSDIVSVKD